MPPILHCLHQPFRALAGHVVNGQFNRGSVRQLIGNQGLRVEVFNIPGQRVWSLGQNVLPVGDHNVVWDGRNDGGQLVGTGAYVVRMRAGEFQQV